MTSLTIDGSHGEGGGQVLRSSLALSMVTGTPFRIERIRAGRPKPGLMRQHLTAVRAAQAICSARVTGDAIGSNALSFEPGPVTGGDYHFAVGSAGSATLVFQTVLPALMLAEAPSHLTLEGGTHNPFAPPLDFLTDSFLPLLERLGPRVTVTPDRPGFYPAGGGRFTVRIEPAPRLTGLELLTRGEVRSTRAVATVANLPRVVAERELAVVGSRLGWPESALHMAERSDAIGPGNILLLQVASEHVTETFTGFGEKNVTAERVAHGAAESCRRYLQSDVPVGEYLADQLLLPLALAGEGVFRTLHPSRHTQTQAELIGHFLKTTVRLEEEGRDRWRITVASCHRSTGSPTTGAA